MTCTKLRASPASGIGKRDCVAPSCVLGAERNQTQRIPKHHKGMRKVWVGRWGVASFDETASRVNVTHRHCKDAKRLTHSQLHHKHYRSAQTSCYKIWWQRDSRLCTLWVKLEEMSLLKIFQNIVLGLAHESQVQSKQATFVKQHQSCASMLWMDHTFLTIHCSCRIPNHHDSPAFGCGP